MYIFYVSCVWLTLFLMAPALVEHSTAKERNSISKEYCKFGTCFSQFDIVFLKKLADSASSFETKSSIDPSVIEMNDSRKKDFGGSIGEMSIDDRIISIPAVKNMNDCNDKAGYKNGKFDYKLDDISSSESSAVLLSNTKNVIGYKCETSKIRPPQPIATVDSSDIADHLQLKMNSCGMKFLDLSRSMNKLNMRLQQIQSRNISAHVACHIKKYDSEIPSKSHESLEMKDQGKSHELLEMKDKGDQCNPELSLKKPWKDLRKVHDMVVVKTANGNMEDDLSMKQRIPVVRTKKKSDNPPPTPDALHQYKVKRSHIGSQCSWLDLKIRALDKKIAELDKFHEKLKAEKKNAKTETNLEAISSISGTSKNKNEPNSITPSLDDQICRRVLPCSKSRQHKYVHKPSETAVINYSCRYLPSVGPCRLCLQSQNGITPNDPHNERLGKLDQSYHSILSFENDISLSFLLEEKLRKERINTKVTISKPTKKKKKKRKEQHADHLGKHYGANKQPLSSKVASDKNYAKSKCDRLKGDDLPRKRTSGIESSVRSRKMRKLSESDESFKQPATPTNELNSPLSQSLPSSAFFPMKQRKKMSSGGDYDINNIVIPYSMAASTRLERIQYKEIPTPGWRNIAVEIVGPVENEECDEITDDEIYTERHMRCEVTERRKFTDYFQPVGRRQRPYHLSESTASGPPSPSIGDELVKLNINTPLDSPVVNASSTDTRSANISAVLEEERETPWTCRTFPLKEFECKNLSTPNSTSVVSSVDTLAESVSVLQNPISSPLLSASDSLKGTSVETPIHTPLETPVPSPLCSPNGTPIPDWNAANPNSWSVKVLDDTPVDLVNAETQRKGIVLKLAKK